MESKAGSILMTIDAILTALGGLAFIVILSLGTLGSSPGSGLIIFLVIAIVLLIAFTFAKFYIAKMMRDPLKTKRAGVHAIIIGVLSGIDILSIIAGIIAISQAGHPHDQQKIITQDKTTKPQPQTILPKID